jgi:CRP-like cAMP-binding protein
MLARDPRLVSTEPSTVSNDLQPMLLRLQNGASCPPELLRLVAALGNVEALPARTMLQIEDDPVGRPRYLLDGWACRFRHLTDGRRQIFGFVLPGEAVGVRLRPQPRANASTVALTPVRLIDVSPLLSPEVMDGSAGLRAVLQAQEDLDERRMLDHVIRLGRLTAVERLAHLLLDLRDRLKVIGQAENDRFQLPLTQETLADVAGLSVVHVNRTLQELRRQDLARLERGWVRLPDVEALARLADYTPAAR